MLKFDYSRNYRFIKTVRKQLDEGLQYFLAMESLSTLDKAPQ